MIVELELTALAAGGDAIGRDRDGRATFVPFGAPGDRVRARIVEEHARWARAELVEVLAPGPDRVTPPCPYQAARTCGGCPWMHVARPAQLAAKRAIAASALRKLIPVGEVAAPVPDLRWRRRVRMHVAGGKRGFHAPRSRAITHIETCLQLDERLDRAVAEVPPEGEGELHGIVGHDGAVQVVLGAAPAGAIELEPGLPARADDFAQASHAGNAALVGEVLRAVAPRQGLKVLELFAGAGNFTRHLLAAGAEVVANDVVAPARPLTTFVAGPAAQAVRGRRGFDVLLLDPPRAGALDVVRALTPAVAPRIVYVSCDVATLARDLAELAQRGWAPKSAQVLDLMPQTAHLEVVAVLER